MTYDQFICWQLKSPITTVLLDLVASMVLALHRQYCFPDLEVSSYKYVCSLCIKRGTKLLII